VRSADCFVAMPQEMPAWQDYARQLKIIRTSTLGKKKNEFESKSQLDELFDTSDGPDKSSAGTLTFNEANRGLIGELKDRTRLKHSDKLVVDTVSEAVRRGFRATRNLKDEGGKADQLDREEYDDMLIYLERFFELLHMFKVIELEKGKPATFKTGGDERPVTLKMKEFALALPLIRAWGVRIEGTPTEIFGAVTGGMNKIGFDAFAHWALKMSVGAEPPEPIQ